MKVRNDRLKKLPAEVSDLTKSLEFTRKQPEDETKVTKIDIKTLQNNLDEVEKDLLDPQDITKKLTELEDRRRRNKFQIDGIEESNSGS